MLEVKTSSLPILQRKVPISIKRHSANLEKAKVIKIEILKYHLNSKEKLNYLEEFIPQLLKW